MQIQITDEQVEQMISYILISDIEKTYQENCSKYDDDGNEIIKEDDTNANYKREAPGELCSD